MTFTTKCKPKQVLYRIAQKVDKLKHCEKCGQYLNNSSEWAICGDKYYIDFIQIHNKSKNSYIYSVVNDETDDLFTVFERIIDNNSYWFTTPELAQAECDRRNQGGEN